jgi:hypothetical protein
VAKSYFCLRFLSPRFCFNLHLGPHCGSIIFCCRRHRLSAQLLVFRGTGSLLGVFLSVARCSVGAALTWIFVFIYFFEQIGGQAFRSTRSARPILPRLALVYSLHAQGFGLVPCCVFLPSFFDLIFDRRAPPWPKLVSDRFFGPLVG